MDLAHDQTLTTGRLALRSLAGFVLLAILAVPAYFGSHRVAAELRLALAELGSADRGWVALAVALFAASAGGAIATWWVATRSCGAHGSKLDAVRRYGVGGIVQTVTPARLGDALRVALFARTVDADRPVLRVGGAYAMIEAARAVALGVLLALAWAVGGMSFWPVTIVAGIALVVVVAIALLAQRTTRGPFARILATARELRREPRAAATLVGAATLSAAFRVLAAASLAASLGIGSPLRVGLVVCAAVDLAGFMPLTPGNVGIMSGAIAVALTARGVPTTPAVALGILFQAAETSVSLALGFVSLLGFSGITPRRRRIALIGVAAAASGAAATLGVTLFV